MTIRAVAIYESGFFRPLEPVQISEGTIVRLTIDRDEDRDAWLSLSEKSFPTEPEDDVFNDLLTPKN